MSNEPTFKECIIAALTGKEVPGSANTAEVSQARSRINRITKYVSGVVDVLLSLASDPSDIAHLKQKRAQLEATRSELESQYGQAA